jgi:hypothetical protein
VCAVGAALSVLLALTLLPVRASAAEPIILGVGVQTGECSYCSEVSGTITGPADAVAYEANNPIALSYQTLLNAPCLPEPPARECRKPLYSGPVAFGLSPSWFVPETRTFRYWAEREVGTCVPLERPGCTWRQERCSPVQTFTIPTVINVACTASRATAAKRHHDPRHRR